VPSLLSRSCFSRSDSDRMNPSSLPLALRLFDANLRAATTKRKNYFVDRNSDYQGSAIVCQEV
ncbi:MAG TPA: hypothetical protein VF888_08710, partial [Nitrospirota bacterium]